MKTVFLISHLWSMQTKKLCFQLGQRGTMDEIPLHFNVSASKAANIKVAQIITGKISDLKETYYIVLSVLYDATELFNLLILKSWISMQKWTCVHARDQTEYEIMKLWLEK